MSTSAIMFYLISAFILSMGVLAVTSLKIFRSAIWLLMSLVGIAALYFWMEVEFIAAVQIIVYVGGIVVIIIFSIFLTQQSGAQMQKPLMKRSVPALLAGLFGLAFTFNIINNYDFGAHAVQPLNASPRAIGTQMLSTTAHGYILPFELVSILLLSAMIGCIVIAMKHQDTEKNILHIPGSENGRGNSDKPAPVLPEPVLTEEKS